MKATPGDAPVSATRPGQGHSRIDREPATDPLPLAGWMGCHLSFSMPVLFVRKAILSSDVRTSQKDALIGGQGRAQNFPGIAFSSRGRCCRDGNDEKAAESIFIIHESA